MRRSTVLAAALFVGTLALFGPVLDHGFLHFDDDGYVTRNPVVLEGLGWDGVRWAFTEVGYGGNWHPLAWLSHMLDVELFGLDPRGHHATSLLLHAANAALLFALLRFATGALWRSAAVALLFAVHPLRVESVAWVAERKDVLCAFFSLLALLAHCRYARRPSAGRYLGTLLLFALALMAKPMAVTLPFLMLLLDVWPLGRRRFGRLALEKAPFGALAAGAAVAAFLAQERSGSIMASFGGPLQRLAHVVVSYAAYVGKLLWPARLSAFYPYPDHGHPPLAVAGAAVLLATLSGAALLLWRRKPWLLAGWLWFLGALVPVVGFVQVGGQAMADRYTYLPLCGLLVAIVWQAGPILSSRPRLGFAAAALLAVPLALATRSQIAVWRDDVTLARHALSVSPGNWLMQNNLGLALARQGRVQEAVGHYREALRARPDFDKAWNNLGAALIGLGRPEEAAGALAEALRANPRYADAHYNLGLALAARGDVPAAERHYRQAVDISPANSDAMTNLGELLLRQGRFPEAVAVLERSLRTNPGDALAHTNLGIALERLGSLDDAVAHYRRALVLQPGLAAARDRLERATRTRGARQVPQAGSPGPAR